MTDTQWVVPHRRLGHGATTAPARSDPVFGQDRLSSSVGIMAYNEEANIGRLLEALLGQQTPSYPIDEIVVLASGCTDRTEAIVRSYAKRDPRIRLLVQPKREGKASAVNLFLSVARSPVLVMVSADTVPEPTAIEHLVAAFADPEVGMAGGRPVPVNDESTFMGFAVHLLWRLHHRVALRRPKLGELTAFRPIFIRIPLDSAVDEVSIEALIRGQGYRLGYVPEAIVRNRGPETVRDFVKQRRRIFAGHLKVSRRQGYVVATMGARGIMAALAQCWRWEWRYVCWTPAVAALELYSRFLGWTDYVLQRRDHAVWEIAATTKGAIE